MRVYVQNFRSIGWEMAEKIQEMKMELTGNESLHFLCLKSLSCRLCGCDYLFKISDQLDEKWLRYSWLKSVSFWLLNYWITLAGSRGSFDPKNWQLCFRNDSTSKKDENKKHTWNSNSNIHRKLCTMIWIIN